MNLFEGAIWFITAFTLILFVITAINVWVSTNEYEEHKKNCEGKMDVYIYEQINTSNGTMWLERPLDDECITKPKNSGSIPTFIPLFIPVNN